MATVNRSERVPEPMLRDQQVPGAGDGQKFGDALDDAEQYDLKQIVHHLGGWFGMTVTAGTSFTSRTGALLLFLGERRPSARSRMFDPVGLYVSREVG